MHAQIASSLGFDGARLDLGCGPSKRSPEHIGIDIQGGPGVDIVGDVFEVLETIPEQTVAEVYSSHFLEHVADIERLLKEITRVVRPGGKVILHVPHFSNPYFYSDITHLHSFGLYSFAYFVADTPFKREVPTYGRELPLGIERIHLQFIAAPPFYARYAFRRGLGFFFNLTRGMQEFYEDNLCYLFPCYEVRCELVRR